MTSALTLNVTKTDLGDTSNFSTPRLLSVVAAMGDADPKGAAAEPPLSAEPKDIPLTAEDTPGIVAYRQLYEGHWYVNIYGEFHRWAGSHYE